MREALLFQAGEERGETLGVDRVGCLAKFAGEDEMCGADRADGPGVIGKREFAVGPDLGVVDKLEIRAFGGGLLHLRCRHVNRGDHRVSHHNARRKNAGSFGVANKEETLGSGRVAGF